MKSRYTAWPAWLHLDGWEGNTKQPVLVVGESMRRYRIQAVQSETVKLAGPRSIQGEETAMVPKYAVSKRDQA